MVDIFEGITDVTELFTVQIKLEEKIPDEMPKYTSDNPNSFYAESDLLGMTKENLLKAAYNKWGMYGFVSWKWINPFVKWIGNRKCLEVMAGRGWLSYALKQKGVNVITTDNFSWHKNTRFSKWNNTVTDIEELDAIESVKKYGKDIEILIMSWAYMDDTAYRVIKELNEVNPNALVVYIGEEIGGCTADDNFFRYFEKINEEEFLKVSKEYQQWWGLHDKLLLGKYDSKKK